MAKREVDVDDAGLAALREREADDELYVELVDGERQPHAWDPEHHRWAPALRERATAAA